MGEPLWPSAQDEDRDLAEVAMDKDTLLHLLILDMLLLQMTNLPIKIKMFTRELPLMPSPQTITLLCWRNQFPGFLGRTTQFIQRFLRQVLVAKDKSTEDTTLTLRPSARCSTSVPMTELEVCPSRVSSVPTELSSTRTISSVTGGSTLTALRLRVSTLSMTRLLPKEKLTLVLLPTLSAHTLLLTMVPSEAMMLPLTWLRMLKLLTVRLPGTQEPDVDLSSPSARGTREEGDRDREDLGVKRRIK